MELKKQEEGGGGGAAAGKGRAGRRALGRQWRGRDDPGNGGGGASEKIGRSTYLPFHLADLQFAACDWKFPQPANGRCALQPIQTRR